MLRHTLAAGLVLATAGGVLATGSAAHADIYAPYARAAAIVNAEGRLINQKNVVSSSRVGPGRYCLEISDTVDVGDAAIQITPRSPDRLPYIAHTHPSPSCHTDNTVAVHVHSTRTGHLADSGFDLTIA